MIVAILTGLAAFSQVGELVSDPKGFIYVAAGPAIPVSDFGSDDAENEEAGLAKTGFTLNLHGGYYITPELGVKVTGFYGRHGVENMLGLFGDVDMGNWQYYGLTVGPLYRVPLTYSMDLTLSGQVGMVNAGSPEVTYQGQERMKDDWSVTMPVKAEAALHFQLGTNTRLLLGADYLYMRPKFNISVLDEYNNWLYKDVEQKMGILNAFVGIGISF